MLSPLLIDTTRLYEQDPSQRTGALIESILIIYCFFIFFAFLGWVILKLSQRK